MEVQLRVKVPLVEVLNAFSAGRGNVQLAVIPSAPAEFRLPVVLLCAQRDFQPTREYPAGTPQSNLDVAAGPQKLQDLLDPERLRSLHDQLLRSQFD